MKFLNLIIVVFLSACAVQGNVLSSKGLINGWDHSGFRNMRDGVEILFYVDNDDRIRLDETLVGITINDRLKDFEPQIGKKPFLIRVSVNTIGSDVYIKQNAKLTLEGIEYLPSKVKVGTDKVKSGRVSNEVSPSHYDDFMGIDNTLQGNDFNWLWLEFDIATPHPNQSFKLNLELKNSERKEVLEANFNAKKMNIYHH